MKIFVAQINPTIGDLNGNGEIILSAIQKAKEKKCHLVLFPEMAISGYPPKDFLFLPHFIKAHEGILEKIRLASQSITVVVGTIRQDKVGEKKLYNSAALFQDQKLVGYQDKMLLPTYDVFSESRYFDPGEKCQLWEIAGKKIAITICEDIWQHSELLEGVTYKKDPILEYQKLKPDLILNLSASPYSLAKTKKRALVASRVALALKTPLILCNQVGGNDGLIFDGHSLYIDGDGNVLKMGQGFEDESFIIDSEEKCPRLILKENVISDLYWALTLGVKDYFHKSGFKKALIGLSGGIDSAVTACIAVRALGKENVLGVAMPSRFSSEGSLTDALKLAENLKVEYKTIPIEEPFNAYLNILEPHFENLPFNTTEENLQARIRGMILMALSNKFGYIVLSTGNKSELAMGFSTLYGDLCGGLGVLSDVNKGYVYKLASLINQEKEVIPKTTIEKPPSAELRHNQKDSDSLPDYAIIDTVLEDYVEKHKSPEEIAKKHNLDLIQVKDLIYRIHKNEYKRRQSPPGLRVTEKAFSLGREFPIVQKWI
jgi:NAD+ synthase (glutamine-hydrolysing)